jgi:hypothetical protein
MQSASRVPDKANSASRSAAAVCDLYDGWINVDRKVLRKFDKYQNRKSGDVFRRMGGSSQTELEPSRRVLVEHHGAMLCAEHAAVEKCIRHGQSQER